MFGQCLYGGEVSDVPKRDLQVMRSVIQTAVWGTSGRRNLKASLLHMFGGKFEPEVARLKRVLKSWIREDHAAQVPATYWKSLYHGSHKGPIGLIHELFSEVELLTDDPQRITIQGHQSRLCETHNIIAQAVAQAKQVLWRRVAQESEAYKGLHTGRNEKATLMWHRRHKQGKDAAFVDILLTDGVYTPYRAHMRWGLPYHWDLGALCMALPPHSRREDCPSRITAGSPADRECSCGFRPVPAEHADAEL